MSTSSSGRQKFPGALTRRNSYSFYTLFLLLAACTLFYYFGELLDFAGLEALRWKIFYSVHDVHRLFFLAPIIYAGYVFGVRASVIVTIIAAGAISPRALFISPFPDPMIRAVLFIIVAGIMGYLTGKIRAESEKRSLLEKLLTSERNKLSGILERMEDGVLITGPDYRIRFMNPSLIKIFGEGVGCRCFEFLLKLDAPCQGTCRLLNVITNGKIERSEYQSADGKVYEVVASPYTDDDGVVCQLATFRNIKPRGQSNRDSFNPAR